MTLGPRDGGDCPHRATANGGAFEMTYRIVTKMEPAKRMFSLVGEVATGNRVVSHGMDGDKTRYEFPVRLDFTGVSREELISEAFDAIVIGMARDVRPTSKNGKPQREDWPSSVREYLDAERKRAALDPTTKALREAVAGASLSAAEIDALIAAVKAKTAPSVAKTPAVATSAAKPGAKR